jgi:hypothetical protein
MTTQTDETTPLIRAAARRLLDIRLPQIIDRAVEQTIHDEPTYSTGPVSRDDLRYHMDRTMRLALARLVGDDIPESLENAAIDVGRIRAHQNVPLSSVLHAFRIDLKTLWEALIAEGRAFGVYTRADFLERSSLMVWESIEASTEEVVHGYQVAQGSREEFAQRRSSSFSWTATAISPRSTTPRARWNSRRRVTTSASWEPSRFHGRSWSPNAPPTSMPAATRFTSTGLPRSFAALST